jgi:CDGSH-type Zn-finger protein
MNEQAKIAQKAPYLVDVKAGKSYFWCSCGESDTQPFCDGSHKGTAFIPSKYEATEDKKIFFCGCKKTDNAPFCDGAHSTIR